MFYTAAKTLFYEQHWSILIKINLYVLWQGKTMLYICAWASWLPVSYNVKQDFAIVSPCDLQSLLLYLFPHWFFFLLAISCLSRVYFLISCCLCCIYGKLARDGVIDMIYDVTAVGCIWVYPPDLLIPSLCVSLRKAPLASNRCVHRVVFICMICLRFGRDWILFLGTFLEGDRAYPASGSLLLRWRDSELGRAE